jgi:hypothetical protein
MTGPKTKNLRYLTREDVLNVPPECLPLAVLSRGYYSHFATEISQFQKSVWNHFMWMIHPGKLVTQDALFHEVPAEEYLTGRYQLKFWTSFHWTAEGRVRLARALEEALTRPWYKRQYDFLQILGIKLRLRQLQIPGLKICSDWANYTEILDPDFQGNHLTPGEVDEWFAKNEKYMVYGKFYPED